MAGSVQTTRPAATSRERIELILSQLQALPTLPAVAIRVLELTTAAESSAAEVTRVVKSDAALTSAILRMLRRADLGVKSDVATVDRAVVLLGFRAVRNAILSQMLMATFAAGRDGRTSTTFWKGFWRHCLAVGCAAQRIAELLNERSLIDQAFVAGLLHDVGKIALDTCMPKSYARVIEQCARRGACLTDVEQEVFGLDHTVAGRRLANHWRLPEAIAQCMWLHHQARASLPKSVRSAQLIHLVHVADNLVRRERIGFSGYARTSDFDTDARTIGLPVDRLRSVAAELPELMAPWLELVSLDAEDSDPNEAIRALTASNRELGRVNEELLAERDRQRVSVQFLETMNHLCAALADDQTVHRVCALASRAVADGFSLERCAVYVAAGEGQCLSLGWAGSDSESSGEAVLEHADSAWLDGPDGPDAKKPDTAESWAIVGPALPSSGSLWRHCFPDDAAEPGWHLPILVDGEVGGGLLFHASPQVAKAIGGSVSNCRALSRFIGQSIATTRARAAAERLNEELFDLNRRLVEAQAGLVRVRSLSMIAEMAAGAAHELNTPLAVISGRAQMLIEKAPDEATADALRTVSEAAQRASRIVADLMEFAKPNPPDPKSIPVADVFDSLRQHWEADPRVDDRQIEFAVADDTLRVYADAAQMQTVLRAVIDNAIEATDPRGGLVNVNSPSLASDKQVRMVIVDNGVGMSADVLDHAMDPCYSSRPAGRGRGMGLSMAHRLAELNGGSLCLESTPGEGTTVTINWPPPST